MEENKDIIISKLNQMDIEYEAQKPFMKDYLSRIEQLIQQKIAERDSGIKQIKESRFSISYISQALGCSRTTLYNHGELLKRYIELSIDLFEQDDPYIEYNKLSASIGDLEEKVSKMTLRDIDTEILREENKNHLIRLKECNEQITRLQTRNAELSKEVQTLKKKLEVHNDKSPKIIQINQD